MLQAIWQEVETLSLGKKIRRKIAELYIRCCLYKIPELKGRYHLWFFRLIFPNFHVGRNPKIWGRFHVAMYNSLNSTISIGDNLHMVSDPKRSGITLFTLCKFTTIEEAVIEIGNNVGLNGVTITSRKRVSIGDNTIIAPNTIIVDTDFHAQWPPESRFGSKPENDREVKIGKNVWISMNVIILKGAQIGDNSIIGAGSVVTSAIPGNVIAAGNPARVVRSLP